VALILNLENEFLSYGGNPDSSQDALKCSADPPVAIATRLKSRFLGLSTGLISKKPGILGTNAGLDSLFLMVFARVSV
jgi:hypothetical protein